MKHSTGKPTKQEAERMAKMKEAGQCVACYQLGIHGRGHIEINHMLSGNKRIGHMATFSLCLWHHQAEPFDGMTKASMAESLGPSLKYPGSKPFRAKFGTDAELLGLQNALLGQPDTIGDGI